MFPLPEIYHFKRVIFDDPNLALELRRFLFFTLSSFWLIFLFKYVCVN